MSISPKISRRHFLHSLGLGTAGLMVSRLPASANVASSGLPALGPVDGVAPEAMLQEHLHRIAFAALDRRLEAYEQLKTAADIEAYQEQLRAFFIRQLGGFPERTPLDARVTGRLDADGYTIEKIIYDSLPGFSVTANLYLPLTPPPYPAVLFSCGHSATGKGGETYQRACALLARNGIAVLNYDPIGQGERYHYLDASGKPTYGMTQEHQLLGLRCRLAGANLATYMIWDGMRGIDYLQSRPDIIADRIGATGNSGGGTLTAYLMALDPRIVCAAPSCYLTGFRKLFETIGPQDSEQNIFGQLAGGLDHADYVLLRAPRPTLMCVATRDYFNVHGAWDIFRQAKRIYTRLGLAERMDLVETDEPHGFSVRLREGMTQWMRRWLLGVDEPVTEPDFALPATQDLLCTPEGQVLRGTGAVSLFDVLDRRQQSLQRRSRPDADAVARVVLGRERRQIPRVTVETSAAEWKGRPAKRLVMRLDNGLWVPALHVPSPASSPVTVLYIHDEGWRSAAEDPQMDAFLAEGAGVLAIDPPGLGETWPENPRRANFDDLIGGDWRQAEMAYVVGLNLVGLRCEAILACAEHLAGSSGQRGSIRLVAGRKAALPALHAAALHPATFLSVHLPSPGPSWSEILTQREAKCDLADVVPGALLVYDLRELAGLIPAEKLSFEMPRNAS